MNDSVLISTSFTLLPVMMCVCACGVVSAGEVRPRMDLNGEWQFRLDPEEKGVMQNWFGKDVPYPDTIRVPGNWQAQGHGEPRRALRHDYQGTAWYRREVTIPKAWEGRRIWVCFQGVTDNGDVYVNGMPVGRVETFITPYEFDITSAVIPGEKNAITCRVDTGQTDADATNFGTKSPVGMFNFWGKWGGIYGNVHLEARADIAIDNVFVMPDVGNRTARAQVVVKRVGTGAAWHGTLAVAISPVGGGKTYTSVGDVRCSRDAAESEPVVIGVAMPDAHTWSPENPFLYTVEVNLFDGDKTIDTVRDRFGMRDIGVSAEGHLLLNGQPYFVRGCGDDTVEVITGTQVPDKEIHAARLRRLKSYGFNGIRFLGHTPVKEYFDAADEVGMLIQAEGELYNVWSVADEAFPVLKDQVARTVRTHCNHPSWYSWACGNEFIHMKPELAAKIEDYVQHAHRVFKAMDPTRLFIASDGVDMFPTDVITDAPSIHQANDGPGTAPEYPFVGLIDEVSFFRKPLATEDIRRLADSSVDWQSYRARVAALAPTAYWPLEEDVLGGVADVSGNHHHGVHESAMTADDLHHAGAFAGSHGIRTGSTGKGVSLNDVAKNVFPSGSLPFSVSVWVRPDAFAVGNYGDAFSFGAASAGKGLLISEDGAAGTGKVRIGIYHNDVIVSDRALDLGVWNHIGLVFDGRVIHLYINGEPAGSAETSVTPTPIAGAIGHAIQDSVRNTPDYRNRPQIWHEFPNRYYGVLPDITADERMTGVFRDDNVISLHRDRVAAYGMMDRYPQIRQRSIDLHFSHMKHVFEDARRMPLLDGYAWWLFTDIPGGVEGDANLCGVLDLFYEADKYPDPAPINQFNSPTVLLIDTPVDSRILEMGQALDVNLEISHYGQAPLENGTLSWQVCSGAEVLQKGVLASLSADVGSVKGLGTLQIGPFALGDARKVSLSVELTSTSCHAANAWEFWVFPTARTFTPGACLLNRTGDGLLDDRYGDSSLRPLDAANVVIARDVTPELLEYLRHGGRVVLLADGDDLMRGRQLTYWPLWVRAKGHFIEEHPAMVAFPNDGFCGTQFLKLFGPGVPTVDFTVADTVERRCLSPIIWALDPQEDTENYTSWAHSNNRWLITWQSVLCEGRVGDGRILVATLRVLEGMRAGNPAAAWLLDCLVDYACSDAFNPDLPAMTDGDVKTVFVVR